ncbi:hypothetical protein HALLA_16260 [Halostagnicola larsenii XH-48]|uniref:Uncharacterized protein n=1 Tax=Halostagnicola larsenii XH-48 TaxID=797299 RepID=W0JVK2_9EURY|nr:hypothetical protein [Halostagnicola larsenii]AHG01093.1 hypothetical protein HALLA_16260 [Halostagnicola larsenii XH-48]
MTEDSLSNAKDELGLETNDGDNDTDRSGLEALIRTGASDGSLALAGGGAFLLAGVRSIARGRFRAIGQLALGGGLLKLGQYQRRNRDGTAIERALDRRGGDETAANETDGKALSDEAHTAAERHDLGRTAQTDEDGDVSADAELGASRNDDPNSDVDFSEDTDELSHSRPGVEGESDPRRGTDDDAVGIDVSDSALAEEPAEATGPDPEQAQPSQTEGTEPETTVDEDASHMRADTPDEPRADADGENEEPHADAGDEIDGTAERAVDSEDDEDDR